MGKDRFERPSSALEAAVFPLNYLPTRREGDLNTRALAGTVVPARPLGRTRGTPPHGETESRTPKPLGSRSQIECSHLSACLTSKEGCSSTLLSSRTPRPGFEPGNPSRDTSVAGRRPTRLDHRGRWVDEELNLGLVHPRHGSSTARPSTRKQLCVYSSVGARPGVTALLTSRGRTLTACAVSNATPAHAGCRPFRVHRRRHRVDRVCLPRWASDRNADVGI